MAAASSPRFKIVIAAAATPPPAAWPLRRRRSVAATGLSGRWRPLLALCGIVVAHETPPVVFFVAEIFE